MHGLPDRSYRHERPRRAVPATESGEQSKMTSWQVRIVNLWFTESWGNKIGRIKPTGTVTEFAIRTENSRPSGITVGPDGNVWFAEWSANQIGRLIISLAHQRRVTTPRPPLTPLG